MMQSSLSNNTAVSATGSAGIPQVDITRPEFKADPFAFYARLRAEAPVYRTVLPNKQPVWLISRYDDVVAAFKDERLVKERTNAMTPEQIKQAPWIPGVFKPLTRNMLDLDAPEHTRLRTLVHKAFTPRLIEDMRARVQVIAHELLDRVESRGRMELIRDYALPLPLRVIIEVLGVPVTDQDKFSRWSANFVTVTSNLDMLKAVPNIWFFMRYLRRLYRARRQNPQADLITALALAEEGGDQFTEDEFVAMVFLLLTAGHETTVNLIAAGTLALLENPQELAVLRADPSLARSTVEELLRFTSPVERATERYAREDITLHGVTIPRGELVLLVLASANRDENHFAEPDRLDITRTPNRHLAFGQGIHYCLGAPLARLEGAIALNTLLARLPALQLAHPAHSLRWRKGMVVRGPVALPVAF